MDPLHSFSQSGFDGREGIKGEQCAMKVQFRGCLAIVVLAAWSAAAFELRVAKPQAGNAIGISFDAVPGSYYDVEASTDLLSWSVLRTIRAETSDATWQETNAPLAARYYRVADLSGTIVIEGQVRTTDGRGVPEHCPFCDILVSSSLDSSIAYTDTDGRYVLRTRAAAVETNVPFTLSFSKIGFRPHLVTVTNPTLPRLDIMSLAGPSNNDFTNRFVISGSETNREDNSQADIEPNEPGLEPSLWYTFTAPQSGTLRFVVDTTEFLPSIDIFKGQILGALVPVDRGTGSNWIEWRIEITRELTVYAGEQFQIRIGALDHPTRGIVGGPFEWRAMFEPDFPLFFKSWDTNHGTVTVHPSPNAAGRYPPGTIVTLSATPGLNYIFTGWGGSLTSELANATVLMDEAKMVAPTFQLANGNFTNATLLTAVFPEGEAWVPLDGSVWYEWTAPRSMPIAVAFDTTNFLHGTVYRVTEDGLTGLANNDGWGHDHLDTRFWAVAGETYKLGVNFEANEEGRFRFRMYEPLVAQGTITGPVNFMAYVLPSFATNALYVYGNNRDFAIWSRIPATPDRFPYSVEITARWFRSTGGLIYSNAQHPNYTLTWAGPPNNDFSNAVHVSTAAGAFVGSFILADTEPGEPGFYPSIWYSFDPPASGTYFMTNTIISTSEVSAWAGNRVAALEPRPGVVHEQTAYAWITEWTAHEGEPMYLRLGGGTFLPARASVQYEFVPGYPLYVDTPQPLGGAVSVVPLSATSRHTSGATVTLTATPEPGFRFSRWMGGVVATQNSVSITMDGLKTVQAIFEVSNDAFAEPFVLMGLPATVSGLNLYATAEPDEPRHGGWPPSGSVWYRWTAPVSGDVLLEFDFVDITIVGAVYTGVSLNSLVPVANNFSGRNVRHIPFTAVANATYHIAVDADSGHGGPFAFTIRPVDEARYILNIEAMPGGFVERSPEPDGNTEYASGTEVMVRAVPLNTYQFVGWEELTWGDLQPLGSAATLAVQMDRHRALRPIFAAVNAPRLNDHFADRHILIADGTRAVSTNASATAEPGEPGHGVNTSGRSVWWSWTAPTTAPIAFSTFGSDFTNVLAVYTGSDVTSLSLVAAGVAGSESRAAFIGDAGITYHVAVDGIAGGAGTVRLQAIENEQFTTEIAFPAPGQSWTEPAMIGVRVHAIDSELSVTRVDLFTNGVFAMSTSNTAAPLFFLNLKSGVLVLSATAIDGRGRIATARSVTNHVNRYQFGTNQFFAAENEGVAQITINRHPPLEFRTEVYLDIESGTALAGVDYIFCPGRVLFQPGESSRALTVPLLADALPEPAKQFLVTLRSSQGTPSSDKVLVTIIDEKVIESVVWIDDAFPSDVAVFGDYSWLTDNPAPASGVRARQAFGDHGYTASAAPGQQQFVAANVLWQDVYLDPENPPKVLSVGWSALPYVYYTRTLYWGDRSLINPWAIWMGPLPQAGTWARLAIPGNQIGTITMSGLTWGVVGGRAVWDRTGIQSWR